MAEFIEEVFAASDLGFCDLEAAYQAEMDVLASLVEMGKLQKWLPRFNNYPGWLQSLTDKGSPLKKIEKFSSGSRVINAYMQDNWLRNGLYMANVAVSCELLNGYKILISDLNQQKLRLLINKHLEQYRTATQSQLNEAFIKFHAIDAVRTMQILRCLRLVTVNTCDIRLLGLGVGNGYKDMVSLHMVPSIEVHQTPIGKALMFQSARSLYHDAVLFESDPQHREYFKDLTKNGVPPTLAISGDSIVGTELLGDSLAKRNMQRRNFVSLQRIDHRMLPDVKRFLRAVLQQVEDGSDLVITMGSGHNAEQFQGRQDKIQEIFKTLSDAGMKPVLIKLHTGKKLAGDEYHHTFGIRQVTTYEILHCKLSPQLADRI